MQVFGGHVYAVFWIWRSRSREGQLANGILAYVCHGLQKTKRRLTLFGHGGRGQGWLGLTDGAVHMDGTRGCKLPYHSYLRRVGIVLSLHVCRTIHQEP